MSVIAELIGAVVIVSLLLFGGYKYIKWELSNKEKSKDDR